GSCSLAFPTCAAARPSPSLPPPRATGWTSPGWTARATSRRKRTTPTTTRRTRRDSRPWGVLLKIGVEVPSVKEK
ncbi:uncharacterized protein ACA1_234930, partial [Acanthamoeba castellanii str. Neff]